MKNTLQDRVRCFLEALRGEGHHEHDSRGSS